MIVHEYDIPEGGQIRFQVFGKTTFCYIEWEQDGISMSVCGHGYGEQNALDEARLKKERMLSA